jgi:CIC family chloride channel protein
MHLSPHLPAFIKALAAGPGPWRLIVLSGIVGVVAGLGAIVFFTMLESGRHLMLGCLAGYVPDSPGGELPLFESPGAAVPLRRWVLIILPALGGLLSGIIVWKFAPEAGGHGTDAAIDAYHHQAGNVRARVPLIKALTAAITIGSGGSGGREGPIAQIGSGFGSVIAKALHLSPRERRILMAAGMAAGVGAIFHAPMAGALFAAEVLYKELDLEFEVIIPSIIASIIAYAIFATRFEWEPIFVTSELVFHRPAQLLPYLVLACAVAAGAVLYIRSFYGVAGLFQRARVPIWLAPAVGGLITGIIGFFVPEALATGYGVLQKALASGTELVHTFGSISLKLLVAVFFCKIATTCFSIGSGGSGGVFGPAIVIGGTLGGIVGILMEHIFPGMDIQAGAFALVGMAGFFAAAANTPISTIIMVSEMTGNYRLLVPSMWVCMIAYLLVRHHTLYTKQILNRFDAPVHQSEMAKAVLKHIGVADVLGRKRSGRIITVPSHACVSEFFKHFANAEHSSFPVVGEDNMLIGIIRSRELRALINQQGDLGAVLIAEDIASPPVTATTDDTLFTVVRRMQANELDELAIVDSEDPSRLLGMLSHTDIVAAYDSELVQQMK